MGNDGKDDVGVAVYLKIEPVRTIDPPLPDVAALVVLFGTNRRVAKIGEQEFELFVDALLDAWREIVIIAVGLRGEEEFHSLRFLAWYALNSSILLNGPMSLPSFTSRKPASIAASTLSRSTIAFGF